MFPHLHGTSAGLEEAWGWMGNGRATHRVFRGQPIGSSGVKPGSGLICAAQPPAKPPPGVPSLLLGRMMPHGDPGGCTLSSQTCCLVTFCPAEHQVWHWVQKGHWRALASYPGWTRCGGHTGQVSVGTGKCGTRQRHSRRKPPLLAFPAVLSGGCMRSPGTDSQSGLCLHSRGGSGLAQKCTSSRARPGPTRSDADVLGFQGASGNCCCCGELTASHAGAQGPSGHRAVCVHLWLPLVAWGLGWG